MTSFDAANRFKTRIHGEIWPEIAQARVLKGDSWVTRNVRGVSGTEAEFIRDESARGIL